MTFKCTGEYHLFSNNGINICFENNILIPIITICSLSYFIWIFEYPFRKQFQKERIFSYLSLFAILLQFFEIMTYKQHFCLFLLTKLFVETFKK